MTGEPTSGSADFSQFERFEFPPGERSGSPPPTICGVLYCDWVDPIATLKPRACHLPEHHDGLHNGPEATGEVIDQTAQHHIQDGSQRGQK